MKPQIDSASIATPIALSGAFVESGNGGQFASRVDAGAARIAAGQVKFAPGTGNKFWRGICVASAILDR